MLEETKDREMADSHIGTHHQLPSDSPTRRSLAFRVTMWFLILAAFAVVFFFVMTHRAAPQRAGGGPGGGGGGGGRRAAGGGGPVTLNTATVRTGDMGVYLQAIGTVTPVYTTSITPQATGPIMAVQYKEGQLVSKGDPLIQIDPRPYQAVVTTDEGVLARDQGLLAQAQMDLIRYQTAWAHNAIQKQILDDQEKLVIQDQGTVKSDQGTLESARVNLSYCSIPSPITGRVGLRLVDPGNVVEANSTTPMVVVAQLQPITVVFTIAEDSVPAVEEMLHLGKPLNVDVYDRSEQKQLGSGTLTSLDNQIDTTTGTLKLRATFPNKNLALFPNLFVNTKLRLKTLKNVTLVDASAIQHNGDESFVYLIQNNVAHLKDVKPGTTDNGVTQVLQGLNSGDVVADTGFEKLLDGSRVVVSKTVLLPSGSMGNEP
jgi:membrane fusion protein, multidrug efflux system